MNAATYAYDGIGNRQTSSVGVVASTYTANSLNQYTAIAGGLSRTPGYDLDGNMTWDGKNSHTWDAENRLVKSEPGGFATNGTLLVESSYDYQNRRVKKADKRLSGRGAGYPFDPSQPGTWDATETRSYIWDGWNIAAEITVDHSAGTTNVTRYVWGLDLSGSVQGAGGVGGLLAVIEGDGSAYYPCYDANGNITEYVDESGTVRAHREYDAFGNTTVKSLDLADSFRFWFSTKYLDEETGNYVYQQRQYIPPLGRWANRDPIGEYDNANIYSFVHNTALHKFDSIGFAAWPWNVIESQRQPSITNGTVITGGSTQLTKWNVIPTKHRTWLLSSCCTIDIKVDGEVSFWWSVAPPRGRLNLTPLQHETSHVQQIRQQWVALEGDVSSLITGEMKCKKAVCLFDVIAKLSLARLNLAYAIGKEFDVRNGQRTEAERADFQSKADDYFQKAILKKIECNAL